ncbi:MAG: 2-oxoacid:ferredoxin oxidoreductase subunit beta, partial [Planctomycetota bacterium]
SFVEIYQNCNIFNDLAFEYATGKETKEDTTLYLEHGKPLIFGKDRHKGIRLHGMDPEIVTLGGDIKEDDLLFHDEKQAEPSLAYLLSRMHYPEFPEPMGVFRCVERPTYEEMVMGQVNDAVKAKGPGRLEDLYDDGETWVVN